ncbi:hypothetical protein [Nonomuraea candida]|uniref:hypothetical protein n=1 Tax=Nonomuraea candida TaxID=359159 RepID=UPI0005B90956|nr:hypothetical protein [Nonomuraea candida]
MIGTAMAGLRRRAADGEVVLTAALLMIAAQLVWKYGLVSRTYFRQDDFVFIARGLASPLSWDYLMRIDFGHLMPGAFAIQWAMGRLGVYNDLLAHTVTICLQAAAGLALLRLLRLLFGTRPAILVPLGFWLLTPMTIPGLSWWAVVAETLPFQIALPMALAAHVHYVRTGRLRHAVAAAGWTVFGMVFFVKAPFIPVLAFVLTLGWLGGIAWRRTWRAWLLYLGVLVPYAVLFFSRLFTSVQLTNQTFTPDPPSAEVAVKSAWTLLTGSLVPTSLGGPWRWHPIGEDYALAATPVVLMWASGLVAAVAVAVSVRWRRRAWLAWLTLLGYFLLADVVPILLGRVEALGPDLSGFELRYVSSTAVLVAVVIGLAFLPVEGEERPWRRPPHRLRWAWAPVALAFAAGSVWSVAAYADRPLGRNVKSYVTTGAQALARVPAGTVVLDGHVPAKVALPAFFYDYARQSTVLGPTAPHEIAWTRRLSGPIQNPMTFDGQGRLRPLRVEGVTIAPKTTPCTPVGAKEVVFRLPAPVAPGEHTVQLAYLNGAETTLNVRLGLAQAAVPAGKDLGRTFATLTGGGAELAVRALGAGACLGEIRIGRPVPDENGAAVPPQALQG